MVMDMGITRKLICQNPSHESSQIEIQFLAHLDSVFFLNQF